MNFFEQLLLLLETHVRRGVACTSVVFLAAAVFVVVFVALFVVVAIHSFTWGGLFEFVVSVA